MTDFTVIPDNLAAALREWRDARQDIFDRRLETPEERQPLFDRLGKAEHALMDAARRLP